MGVKEISIFTEKLAKCILWDYFGYLRGLEDKWNNDTTLLKLSNIIIKFQEKNIRNACVCPYF